MHLRQTLDHACQIALRHPATVHIENGNRREQSWAQLRDKALRGARMLRARGIRPGDRVVIAGNNSDRWIEAWYTLVCADLIAVPMNIRLSAREMRDIMDDCKAAALIYDESCRQCADETRGALLQINLDQEWEQLLASAGTADPSSSESASVSGERAAEADVAALYYTGGTTGKPKGVMLTHANLMHMGLITRGITGIDHNTRHLHVAPLFHIADGSIVPWVTWVGGTHYTIGKFDPLQTARVLANEKLTHVMMVPTMVAAVVAALDEGAAGAEAKAFPDFTQVQRVIYGGAPMPEKTLKRALEIFPQAGFMQVYGMTELSPYATVLEPDFHRARATPARLASAGRAIPGIEVRVANLADGSTCPPGMPGEVRVRSLGVMKGYWNNPEATAKAIVDGWMCTGDIGFMDEDGFLTICDRAKDMIITGGENVYSIEVEAALLRHPAVRECAVIGVPDEKWGETVCAVVYADPQAQVTPEQLIAHCRSLLGGFKCPRRIELRADPLPRSGAGKILKNELREPYWQQHARRVA